MPFDWKSDEGPKRLLDTQIVESGVERLPVALCLDASGSMGFNNKIKDLNMGLHMFVDTVLEDKRAAMSVDLTVVAFNESGARVRQEFRPIQNVEPSELTAFGGTPLGEGVNLALDLLEERKRMLKEKGVPYYQPWLFIMSDGDGNGDPREFERAASRIHRLLSERRLNCFAIAIGSDFNRSQLERLTGDPKRVKVLGTREGGFNFRDLFIWLSKSMSVVANSGGDPSKAKLPPSSDWEVNL